jgi:hypothetical protein
MNFWTETHASSDKDAWSTPQHIVQLALDVLDTIDLDPASDGITIPARLHYTGSPLDGLIEPWRGRVWLNPPYARTIGQWVRKAVAEYESGNVTEMILLVPARVDTRWFRGLLGGTICFLYGRLKFGNQPAPAPFPSALIDFGPRPAHFVEVFGPLGWIAEKIALADGTDG